MIQNMTCFVIAPIGEPDSEIRKRSDQILKHVIDPAVTDFGYEAVRADQISKPGQITSQVIQHIVDDPLVVADLTGRNPNVFYELALRHAIRKPFLQLIQKGEELPFDVAGTRTIHVDYQDLDSAENARAEMIRQIQALHDDSTDLETPISVSLDLQALRQSENPTQRSIAEVASAVSELRASVAGLEKRIDFSRSAIPSLQLHEIFKQLGVLYLPSHPIYDELEDLARSLELLSGELSSAATHLALETIIEDKGDVDQLERIADRLKTYVTQMKTLLATT